MTTAWVLMTAMPPTKGHLNLIEFARRLDTDDVCVLLNTQPGEPFCDERHDALWSATQHMSRTILYHHHETIQQNPVNEYDVEFWEGWAERLQGYGQEPGDLIVASEDYGIKLAEFTGCKFIPYDPDRSIFYTRATPIRSDLLENFQWILPDFQSYLRKRITFFGAESVGKTTLSKNIAEIMNSLWIPEYARPYLETVGPEITVEAMENIWRGQKAWQLDAERLAVDKPLIVQDTDLFSTVGYWEGWDDMSCPLSLIADAQRLKSDLYIIPRSNIPFEEDPLRYGGDEREFSDEYWIAVCEKYELPYVVLDRPEKMWRVLDTCRALDEVFDTKSMSYERE